MQIKREKWKVKGKFKLYVVVRVKGRIKSRRAWSRKFTLKDAQKKLHEEKTLKKGVRKFHFSTATEFTREDNRKPRRSFAVRAAILIGSEVITATSLNQDWRSLDDARQDAKTKLYRRVDQIFTGEYDEEEGEQVLTKTEISSIKFQTVYYADTQTNKAPTV